MPKPINMQRPEWTQAEMSAVAFLYRAGWGWDAISAHVSAIYGHQRSPRACQSRGETLCILDSSRKGHQPLRDYEDDIRDMMVLGYSSPRMVDELRAQYGVSLSQAYVYKRIRAQGPQYAGWKRRVNQQRRERLIQANADWRASA